MSKKQQNLPNKIEDYKVAICGAGAAGKSSLTVQFVQNVFLTEYDPTIEDSYRKQFRVDNKPVMLEVLDTAGQEEYKALRDQYMRNAKGFIIVYDITNRHSFDEVQTFVQQILQVKDKDKVPLVIVGNKCDLESERSVTKDIVSSYASTLWDVKFLEASAKLRKGVDEIFEQIVREIRKEEDLEPPKPIKRCTLL